uniref:Uncharacterized protein n=1 Tax=Magallana gigas TaxID=29159 RepID=K1PTD2_MAGGI
MSESQLKGNPHCDEENTPLTIACLNNRIDIVNELIEAKANVNVEAGGNTPLTAACEKGDRCIVEMGLVAIIIKIAPQLSLSLVTGRESYGRLLSDRGIQVARTSNCESSLYVLACVVLLHENWTQFR